MASVISSSSNRIVTQQQLNTILNAYNKVDIKWLSLHLSNLSGEYHPIPSDASIVIGWWGNVLSTADGTLPTPETLTIQEDAVRSFHNVNIATDDSYDAYISGVTFTFYNGANQVYTHNYTPDKFVWYTELPQVIDADKIVITITKLSKASRIARIRSVLDSHLFTRVDTLSSTVVDSSTLKAITLKTVAEPITLHADDLAHTLIKAFWSDNFSLSVNGNTEKTGNPIIIDTPNVTINTLRVTAATKQTVTVQGKNLFPSNTLPTTWNGITFTNNSDGTHTLNGTATTAAGFFLPAPILSLVSGTSYAFSTLNTLPNKAYLSLNNISSTMLSHEARWKVFNSVSDRPKGWFWTDAGAVFNNYVLGIQLEVNTAVTAYAPFVPNSPSPDYPAPITGTTKITVSDGTTAHDYMLPQSLYSLPDGTADEYDVVSGSGTQNIQNLIFDGSIDENWLTYGVGSNDTNNAAFEFVLPQSPSTFDAKSNRFTITNAGYLYAHDDEGCGLSLTGNYVVIKVAKSRMSGWSDSWTNAQKVAAFKAFLASNPVTVLYELATPQTITGTGQTIPTYTTTNVSTDGSSVTVNYVAKEYVNITAKLTEPDILNTTFQEQNDILAKLARPEQIPLTAIDNLQHFINEFNPGDTTNLSFGDMSSMYNIHTVMTDPNRQTFGRVEILYTDPFLDNDIALSTSSQNHISNIDQMLDNQKTSTYQWFFLGRSDLSGKYHPAGVSTEVGWIGNIPSAADGTLSTPEVLTITFSARVIAALQMIGDTASNCFPVDFTIQLFGADDVLLHTETIVDNTSLAWSKNITYVTQVTKLVFTITKINKPNTFVHLLETYTSVLENYYNEQIVSMSLLEEYGPDTSNLGDNNSLGTISANELDVSLDNTDNTFTISNTSSRLYGVLKRNRRIRAWLGAKVADRIEWYPLGVFYSTQWGASSDDLSASVTGMDSLYLCGSTPLQNMYVYTDKSLYWLFDLVLSEVLKPEQYHIDESLQSIILPFAWFDEGSVANALLKLTASWLISVYCDRNGVVQVQPIHSTPNVVITMSDDKNIVTRDEKLAYDQMPNHVEVTATTYYAEATSNIVELSNVTVSAGIMELKVPYTVTPCTDVVLGTITADEGISVVLKAAYSWGAVLTITANTPGTIASLVLTGKAIKVRNTLTAIAKDDIAIIQDGDNKKSIAPSLLQDFSLATQAANQVLNAYEHAKKDLDVVSLGDIAVTLGDKVQLDDTKFLLYRQQLDWSGGLEATVSLKYLDEGDA
jgi:hypothetical protein